MDVFILAIDQGTSSTKTIVFDQAGRPVAKGSAPLNTRHFPNGFVEQEPGDIVQNALDSVQACLTAFRQKGHKLSQIVSCGVSNQRETFVLWDAGGKPLSPAVVWACKRSTDLCAELKAKGQEPTIQEKTGLILDPYFSATKLLWLLQNDAALKALLDAGQVHFGTVDAWLLYRLTGEFRTDYTNACRTLLFNIRTLSWDQDILRWWGLEKLRLPAVCPSSYPFGASDFAGLLPSPIPIAAMIGDSHAAAFGEGCFEPGTAKITLGTGSSILMNTGAQIAASSHGMLTTICWSMENRVDYALEGAIVACGSTLEWLKNELRLFNDPPETERMANAVPDNGGVYLIPAFSGLGAPHWQMDRKASIHGMTFGTTRNHLVRAALESIPYQVKDVIEAMRQDMDTALKEIAVNGGIANNGFVIRLMADLLGLPLSRQSSPDISAAGAAYLAGLKSGVFQSIEQLSALRRENTTSIAPVPQNEAASRGYRQWQDLIRAGSS